MYAVIDVETTGWHPGQQHRICEIAIVHVDERGRITDQWSSLVNPGRDLGPQHVHRIRAADVRRAPTFEQLAAEITERLRHRLIAAHNLAFDARFVAAEYARLGATVPVSPDTGLCTMRLAPVFFPLAGRSLADCCLAAGIPHRNAHTALYDAVAAARLLGCYVTAAGRPAPWDHLVESALTRPWPSFPPSNVAPLVRGADNTEQPHFLARLVDRLPRVTHPPQADTYLALLDGALLDRHLSASEQDALVEMAQSLDLTRSQVKQLHEQYLRALATEAADDGVVTEEELADLHAVATLLGLDADDVDTAIKQVLSRPYVVADARTVPRFTLSPGDLIAFTGQMDEPRDLWEARARRAGLQVGRSVTRQTRLLVAADPDTLSGKGRQARKYGIPIVQPAAFRTLLDRM